MRCLSLLLLLCAPWSGKAQTDWSAYGHDAGGTRYSPLKAIDASNVAKLKVAWTYKTGALQPATDRNQKAAFESTPILIDGLLYLTTPFNAVIALDPATGAEKWKYDPKIDRTHDYSEITNRGVSAWIDTAAPRNAPCRLRLFEGTIDARLLAIDGKTGKPCADFGIAGAVDLTKDVDYRHHGDYEVTSAPAIVGNLVITGSAIGDNGAVDMERGLVRAFDTKTGKLRWTWDPLPWSNQQTLRTGAANAWGAISADPARDLIFIPTGSPSPDYYGGLRPGNNAHGNSVVALKASTGALVWSYQVVHHDLWDYDVASQPVLIDFRGRPAVAINTKMGLLFVIDRETGKPLIPIEERPVPKSDVQGEEASATQPVPAWSPLNPLEFKPWGPTPEAEASCRKQMAALRSEGIYTPPSLKGTLVFPGNLGGVNWGGAAWDPRQNLLYANTNRIAAIIKLVHRADLGTMVKTTGKLNPRSDPEFARMVGTPYALMRDWVLSSAGTPCNAPPWGALVAFDLATGKVRWESPVGELIPGQKTGSPTLGGPIVTAGGIVVTAAGMDTFLRAFDSATGAELWKAELPASAQSTPMTYEFNGRQYLVICAGGHGKLSTKMGDSVVAFAL